MISARHCYNSIIKQHEKASHCNQEPEIRVYSVDKVASVRLQAAVICHDLAWTSAIPSPHQENSRRPPSVSFNTCRIVGQCQSTLVKSSANMAPAKSRQENIAACSSSPLKLDLCFTLSSRLVSHRHSPMLRDATQEIPLPEPDTAQSKSGKAPEHSVLDPR